jgi:hypothetical protein
MHANLGGTNIVEPLLAIFKEKTKPGIPRQVFLLTDGEVDNTELVTYLSLISQTV